MDEKENSPKGFDHIMAILALPFMVVVVVPAIIMHFSKTELIPLFKLPHWLSITLGLMVLILGLILFVKTIQLFIKIGNGTLAPWHPTKKIVVKGLYRHVRNPMLIGVNLILLGEAFLLGSGNILIWMIFFVCLNHLYFVFKEEPDLVKRFGAEYQEYRKHVPRWIPRIEGWKPEDEN